MATEDELTKFLSLLNTSIAKQYSTGKNIDNAIVIDSLVSSRIDHAVSIYYTDHLVVSLLDMVLFNPFIMKYTVNSSKSSSIFEFSSVHLAIL